MPVEFSSALTLMLDRMGANWHAAPNDGRPHPRFLGDHAAYIRHMALARALTGRRSIYT